MSESNPPDPPMDAPETQTPNDSLGSPTFIIAVLLIIVASGTMGGLFWKASPEIVAPVAAGIIGSIFGAICGYYYGASKHAAPQGPTS
jgi:hypothetical protein